MDLSNPYKPPEAVLGAVAIGSEAELAAAVVPFVASHRNLRILGLLAALGALVSGLGSMSSGTLPEGSVAVMLALVTGAYFVASMLLFRLASGVKTLAKEPTLAKVAGVLDRMTQTWVIGVGALVLMSAGSWAQRVVAATAATPAMWQLGPHDTIVAAAAKLRRVLVIAIGTTGALMFIGLAGNVVKPPPESAAMGASMLLTITLVSAVVQLGFLWLVWRQIPALDDFIARPNAATLRQVASAHALIWRVIVAAIGLVMLAGMIAAVALPMVFRR